MGWSLPKHLAALSMARNLSEVSELKDIVSTLQSGGRRAIQSWDQFATKAFVIANSKHLNVYLTSTFFSRRKISRNFSISPLDLVAKLPRLNSSACALPGGGVQVIDVDDGDGLDEAAEDPEAPAHRLDHGRVQHARGDPGGHLLLVLLAPLPQRRGPGFVI